MMVEAANRKTVTLNLEKATEWLKTHWKGGWNCPICGNTNWSGQEYAMELRPFDEGRLASFGQVVPLLTITCKTCGNTLFFNAILAGLVEKPEEK